MLFLGQLYGLSDRELLEQITDRISFRRFLAITNDKDIPDRSLLIGFRSILFGNREPEKVFNRLFKKLHKQGLVFTSGSIVDSTIVESPGKKSRAKSRRDKKASFTKKHGKTYFGYKMHIAVHNETKLITRSIVTPANEADSTMLHKLIRKRITNSLFADKGYASPVQEKVLESEGIQPMIMRKSYRNNPLSTENEERNRVLSKTRARVEHVNARIKNEFHVHKTQYFTKTKNAMSLLFKCILYNIKTANRLQPNWAD